MIPVCKYGIMMLIFILILCRHRFNLIFFFVLYFLGVKSGDNVLKFKGTVTVV